MTRHHILPFNPPEGEGAPDLSGPALAAEARASAFAEYREAQLGLLISARLGPDASSAAIAEERARILEMEARVAARLRVHFRATRDIRLEEQG